MINHWMLAALGWAGCLVPVWKWRVHLLTDSLAILLSLSPNLLKQWHPTHHGVSPRSGGSCMPAMHTLLNRRSPGWYASCPCRRACMIGPQQSNSPQAAAIGVQKLARMNLALLWVIGKQTCTMRGGTNETILGWLGRLVASHALLLDLCLQCTDKFKCARWSLCFPP